MKTLYTQIISLLLATVFLNSCATKKVGEVKTSTAIDPVCAMSLNKSESYVWKYSGTKYYFDSFDCKESFKANPQNFLDKKCVPNDSIMDLVCGKKVDITESYDYKSSGRVYHFHSYECKESFKMNPEKFIKNKCATPVMIKK